MTFPDEHVHASVRIGEIEQELTVVPVDSRVVGVITVVEQKAKDLQEQANAHRALSSSLAYDDVQPATA